MVSSRISLIVLLAAFVSTTLVGQTLISISYKGQRSQEALAQDYGFLIQNGVEMWKVTYTTPDVFNQ